MSTRTTRTTSESGRRARLALATCMAGAGVTHFVSPATYERIVPRWAGDPHRVVAVSGIAELACAALLANRRTAGLGGWLTAALLVAVFPANVQMWLDAGTEHQAAEMPADRFRLIALARLPLQLPLVLWALRVARRATTSPSPTRSSSPFSSSGRVHHA
jgi:uncharacterized membrane protein